jgi:hypothetical protein
MSEEANSVARLKAWLKAWLKKVGVLIRALKTQEIVPASSAPPPITPASLAAPAGPTKEDVAELARRIKAEVAQALGKDVKLVSLGPVKIEFLGKPIAEGKCDCLACQMRSKAHLN